jgi:alpha-beta hydrolase superfamily lysophospholipase
MRRRLIRITLILLLFPPLLAAVAGWLVAPGFLTPIRRELTPDLVREADASFAVTHSFRQDFDVRASDGALLRGWKVTPPNPNGSWVLLFHGVADNRVGVIGQSEFLLRAGYSVLMMDARAHGASEGPIATYGWLERNDTRAITDALISSEFPSGINVQVRMPSIPPPVSLRPPRGVVPLPAVPQRFHIFALGESMGAGIALQSAAADPRIEAVVAEASFADLREASYDYAGLRKSPLLGKTLLAPFSWTLLYRGEKAAGFPLGQISPMKAVAARPFPVLLICDEKDEALPCRHSQMIYTAARGPKDLWMVPRAFHTAALQAEAKFFDAEWLGNVVHSAHARDLQRRFDGAVLCQHYGSDLRMEIVNQLQQFHAIGPRQLQVCQENVDG